MIMQHLMKTRVKKHIYRLKKLVVFDLIGLKINADMLVKLLDVFKMQRMVVCIESLSTRQGLYEVINEYELDGLIATLSSDGGNAYVVFTCTVDTFKEISDVIVSGNPEIMFIADIKNDVPYQDYLDKIRHFKNNELIVKKMSDFTLSAMFDEDVVSISFSADKYDVSTISKNICKKPIKAKKNSL